jgi:D-alanyl-D-alanine dipeptidase
MSPITVILQILVVATLTPDATTGTLQRFERTEANAPWTTVGPPIPVSVGEAGIGREKREGDRRSPEGVFPLGAAFGTNKAPARSAWPYTQVRKGHLCVDDPKSVAYGKLVGIDSGTSKLTPDWRSAEDLRIYARAILVEYNRSPSEANRGSCIFLHPWGAQGEATLGCTAMSSENLDSVIGWLVPASHPRFVQGVAPSPHDLMARTRFN